MNRPGLAHVITLTVVIGSQLFCDPLNWRTDRARW